MAPPFARMGASHKEWERIGASPWILRQLRFGLQLPWTREPMYRPIRSYKLQSTEAMFAREEFKRWTTEGYARPATKVETQALRRQGRVSPAFVTKSAGKLRLVVDYSEVNKCLEQRTFRMDQLADLVSVLQPKDSLFKADITDAYYHLRLRSSDQMKLTFQIGDQVYIPLCLNCGLSVAPWFFTKIMKPVVAYLRKRGHRVYSYLDDFFGAARPGSPNAPASEKDTRVLELEFRDMFGKLGISIHPRKCDFTGSRRIEVLGILIDTERAMFC